MKRLDADGLKPAERLYARGRWQSVISMLEPLVPFYRESARFYCLLGGAFLRLDDARCAATYLDRAWQLNPCDLETRLFLAAARLVLGETEKAVAIYLGILDDFPDNKEAAYATAFIRKNSPSFADNRALVRDGRMMSRILPVKHGLPASVSGSIRIVAVLLFIVLAGALFGVFARQWTSVKTEAASFDASLESQVNRIVTLKGVAANITSENGHSEFVFMAGHENMSEIRGLIPVTCSGIPPGPDSPIEVTGKIVKKKGIIMIEASEFRYIGKRE